jgi:hypothetical protein
MKRVIAEGLSERQSLWIVVKNLVKRGTKRVLRTIASLKSKRVRRKANEA